MDTDTRHTIAVTRAIAYAEARRARSMRVLASLPPQSPTRALLERSITEATLDIAHLRTLEGATT